MRSNFAFLIITLFITSTIIFSWFSTQTIISNGSEEDLNIINVKRTAERYSTGWYSTGTGYVDALGILRYPFLVFLSIFQSIGFPPFLIQAFAYWLIMNLGIIFMYILLKNGFGLNKLASGVGSYLYLLNLYSMTQIWFRNVYQSMFPWLYLPLFIFLWIKWLDEGKLRWLFTLVISSVVFSHAFAHPGYTLAFVTAGVSFFLIKLWQNRKEKKMMSIKLLTKSLLALFLLVVFNLWWFYPLVYTALAGGSSLSNTASNWDANFSSLVGVSQYSNTLDVFFLRQQWYFNAEKAWYGFYDNPLIFLLSLAIFSIVIVGIIASKKKSLWSYFTTLFLVGWFISKGSSFPLGYSFFYLFFATFPLAGALRNPYEKFGIIWLLAYSAFFGYGIDYISKRFQGRNRYIFLTISLVFSLGILVYPMWTGSLFPVKERLSVPAYYTKANEYLTGHSSKRIFNIPFLAAAERVRFDWGYIGEDPSENIFEPVTISKGTLPLFEKYYELIPQYLENPNLPALLGLLGVDRVIYRKDVIYPDIALNHLLMINDLEKMNGLSKEIEVEKLVIYKLNPELVKPDIYTLENLVVIKSVKEGLDQVIEGTIDVKKAGFILEDSLSYSDGVNPNINFVRLQNNHYKIMIEGASAPFILVLNDTYNKLWQASISGDTLEKHFMVNGFANGWLVEKTGNYEVELTLKIAPWL